MHIGRPAPAGAAVDGRGGPGRGGGSQRPAPAGSISLSPHGGLWFRGSAKARAQCRNDGVLLHCCMTLIQDIKGSDKSSCGLAQRGEPRSTAPEYLRRLWKLLVDLLLSCSNTEERSSSPRMQGLQHHRSIPHAPTFSLSLVCSGPVLSVWESLDPLPFSQLRWPRAVAIDADAIATWFRHDSGSRFCLRPTGP